VENVSTGGLGLRLRYALPVGAVVHVDLHGRLLSHGVRVRVVYAVKRGGHWWAGCAFERAPRPGH
jgi:hypothetical protein